MDNNRPLKFIVLGNKGVGKSNLIRRYAGENFLDNTENDDLVHDEFIEKDLTLDNGLRVRATVWDPAMFQANDKIVPAYYIGVNGCCLVFSTVDENSFKNLVHWYTEVMTHCQQGAPIVLVENKIDLIDQTQLNAAHVESLAKQHKLRLYRVSAKENINVNDVFAYLIRKCVTTTMNPNSNTIRKSASASVIRRQESSTSVATDHQDLSSHERADSAEPSRRRTGGVKPVFNRYKCPVM